MDDALTRRMLLGSAAAGAATLSMNGGLLAEARRRRRTPIAREGEFDCGVMSGDPTHRAVTLWTRLGGEQPPMAAVRLEVARDPEFRRVVARQRVPAAARTDHTVKVRVGGLAPDERYWYRFSTRTGSSPVGRTQTAPAPGSRRPVRIAFFSCQQYTSGFYGAYRHLLEQDPDVVLCLGDYIYERQFYIGRRPDPTGANGDGEVHTLDEYRSKYRHYRTDPDLRALHADVPFLAMWDDHEVEDNYAGRPGDTPDDGPRIAAGHRAFHEYMPNLTFKEGGRTYRRFSYGRHLELLLLDERSYRDDQPCNDATGRPCPDSTAPRDFLGRRQLAWLKGRLQNSPADWKVVGNQLMIQPLDVAPGVPLIQDSWEGYQSERRELCSTIRSEGVRDVAFLTGDIHSFFAGRVLEGHRSGPAVAVEYVGGSTTTPGISETPYDQATERGSPVGPPSLPQVTPVLDVGAPVVNPSFDYANTRERGYAVADVGADALRVAYFASRDVTTPEGSRDVRVLQRFVTPRGEPRVILE